MTVKIQQFQLSKNKYSKAKQDIGLLQKYCMYCVIDLSSKAWIACGLNYIDYNNVWNYKLYGSTSNWS